MDKFIWDIGKCINHSCLHKTKKWRENLLGKILTEVREQLRKEMIEN